MDESEGKKRTIRRYLPLGQQSQPQNDYVLSVVRAFALMTIRQ